MSNLSGFVLVFGLICHEIAAADIGGRIVSGDPARKGQFPFMAAIYKTTDEGKFFCSGVLLSPEWVLTTAQCVSKGTSFEVVMGSNSLDGDDDNRVSTTTDIYFYHTDYNATTLSADIGLIQFFIPVTFTNYISAVTLLNTTLAESQDVVAVGWGQISDQSDLSNELNYVQLTVINNVDCFLIYGSQIMTDMACAVGSGNKGICTGDNGGPLLTYDEFNNVAMVGVASFLSGNGCDNSDPSGFTRIAPYYHWITALIADN